MKKTIKFVLLLLTITFTMGAKALSVDKNDLTIGKGTNTTVTLYADVDSEITEVYFTLVYSTYDVPASFNIESGLKETKPSAISHKVVFSSPVSGKIKLGDIKINVVNNPKGNVGSVNVYGAKALNTDNEMINLNPQTINVKIEGTETGNNTNPIDVTDLPKNTNLLERIDSSMVKIDLQKDVYEYTVDIDENVGELDLIAIPKDEKYEIETSTQKIADLEDGKITITVKDGEYTENYTINVNVDKEEDNEIDKDEDSEVELDDSNTTYKYKGKWVTLIVVLVGVLYLGVLMIKKR